MRHKVRELVIEIEGSTNGEINCSVNNCQIDGEQFQIYLGDKKGWFGFDIGDIKTIMGINKKWIWMIYDRDV